MPASGSSWLDYLSWAIAIAMTAITIYTVLAKVGVISASPVSNESAAPLAFGEPAVSVQLPELTTSENINAIYRQADQRTILSTRSREDVVTYTVEAGDSVFGIAQTFNLAPESVLWANYDVLNDDPHMISIGQELKIPPTNGVLYTWKEGDTVEKVAEMFKAKLKTCFYGQATILM